MVCVWCYHHRCCCFFVAYGGSLYHRYTTDDSTRYFHVKYALCMQVSALSFPFTSFPVVRFHIIICFLPKTHIQICNSFNLQYSLQDQASFHSGFQQDGCAATRFCARMDVRFRRVPSCTGFTQRYQRFRGRTDIYEQSNEQYELGVG
jgi:hypothetical protein